MVKEKEIEKIARVFCVANERSWHCICNDFECDDYCIAQKLYNAGYGNVKQAVREFAERLKAELRQNVEVANRCYECAKSKSDIYGAGLDLGEITGTVKAIQITDSLIEERYGDNQS